jgi:pyridoxine kinase
MPTALILSSHVASSRVGGSVQALALSAFRVDPVLAPTVLYGRHPGWGAPGGAAVPIEAFEGMLDGIEANGAIGQADLVITGYFGSADQVRAAARVIDAVRAAPRDLEQRKRPIILVDPVMGDAGKGLYVAAEVAQAIEGELIRRADLIAPNAWELERLAHTPVRDPASAVSAARIMGKATLVSSVARAHEIGIVYADRREAWLAAHVKSPNVPNGTGDLLTALFAAHLLDGQPISYALARAAGGLVETIGAAKASGLAELPVVDMGQRMKGISAAVRMERLG